MGAVHDLVLKHGAETARSLATTKQEKLCVDIAARMLAEEEEHMGVTHAGFALTSLPHKAIDDPVWVKDGYHVRLLVESGRNQDTHFIGVPYGSKARLILLYLQTQALRNNSRSVELGRSMKAWMEAMGLSTGGATYRIVSEQAKRISACRLTFFHEHEDNKARHNGAFVDTEIAMFRTTEDDQPSLWTEHVVLNEHFFASLQDHAVPLLEAAIREINSKSMALDVYIWLAYRLHVLNKSIRLSWLSVYSQFGTGFKAIRQFKPTFREALALALAVYPEARVEEEKDGLLLYPSRPPVSKRVIQSLLPLSS